ncbi:hypothetical protein HYPSUDRAFT_199835 [Hypholoma sublateritium FD-334 SS-4]|uniref:Uncharacterized protein n=1 Tax=Hypholoma sublateritium (strain FD-334 SS-4) TaxID=945553 RepID=A0A0D2Q1A0_HYPSF|nr:hypothetical protein HYPSUDRAFT_199835 [Hypholoma sublateritium FD-334 SS-4]
MPSAHSSSSTTTARPLFIPISGETLRKIMIDIQRALQVYDSNPSGDIGASSSSSSLTENKGDQVISDDGDENEDNLEGSEEGDDDGDQNDDRENEEDEEAVEDVSQEGPENPVAVAAAPCGEGEARKDSPCHAQAR